MIRIFGMPSCPDCAWLDSQIAGDDRFEKVDISASTTNLKAFLLLRDTSPAFEGIRGKAAIGIPCLVLEDGTVTLSPEDAGLKSHPKAQTTFCSLDGKGC